MYIFDLCVVSYISPMLFHIFIVLIISPSVWIFPSDLTSNLHIISLPVSNCYIYSLNSELQIFFFFLLLELSLFYFPVL